MIRMKEHPSLYRELGWTHLVSEEHLSLLRNYKEHFNEVWTSTTVIKEFPVLPVQKVLIVKLFGIYLTQ